LENAIENFRKALHINPRHYNAMYGLGIIYFKQEKLALAEYYLKKALDVSQHNPVLLNFLGMVNI
jgi:anaphase-promoting complex subunit 3